MLRNGLYNLLGGAIRVFVTLLTVPLLLRIVGVEEYGLLTLVLATINLVALAEAGLSVATTVFVARDKAQHDIAGMSATLTVCVVATTALATAAAIAIWIIGSASGYFLSDLTAAQSAAVTQSLRIGAFVVWVRLLQQIMSGVLQGFGRYGAMNMALTAQALLSNLGMVAIAWSGGRTPWLISWQAVVSVAIALIYLVLSVRLLRDWHPRCVWHSKRARDFASFSLYSWASALGSAMFTQFDRLLIGALLGLGPLGVYGAIASATTQINALSGLVVQPLMPAISSLTADSELHLEAIRAHIKRAWQTLVFVAFGLGGALFVLAPLVLQMAAPEIGTPQNATLLRLTTVIYTLYSLNALGYYVLLGTERVRECMLVILCSALLALALLIVGATHWGLVGAVAGNAGFIATLFLNRLALRDMAINIRSLLSWVRLPLVWAIVSVCCSLLLGGHLLMLMLLFIGQSAVLVVWFATSQQLFTRTLLVLRHNRKAHP